jgi:CheY-like chemotaxis protein
MPHILIVEDEAAIADTLIFALQSEGFTTTWLSLAEHALAEHAQAHHAHRTLSAGLGLALPPAVGPGIGLDRVELPIKTDHRLRHILGHLHRHAGVVEPKDGHAGWQAALHQGIDACADVKQGLECGLLVEQLLRRRPHQGVIGQRCARLPELHLGLRKSRAQLGQPGLGLAAVIVEKDAHGGIVPRGTRNGFGLDFCLDFGF